MELNEPRSCPVCTNTFDTKYCEECGVHYIGKRVTSIVFFSDVIESFFGMHRSVLQNFKQLILNPGKVIESYWNGFRRAYYSPGRMMLIASLMLATSFYFNENFFLGINVSGPKDISTNMIFILIMFPVFVLSTQLSYFRMRKNFYEHVVLNAYVFGLLISVFALLSLVEGLFYEGSYLQPFLILFYFIWVARVFEKKWFRIILMTLINILVISAFAFGVYLLTELKK